MITWFWYFVARFLLWLRYRVRVRGMREVTARGTRGILLLPNHPALIDPVILMSRFWGPLRVRALAHRYQIDRFLIRRLARRFRVIPIPEVAMSGPAAADEVREIVAQCVEALRAGDNLVLYPGGRLQRTCLEDLGGNSAVETILREVPDVRVVLVRTRGLWGSRFGWGFGGTPDVAATLRRGALSLLASGVFFAPRRKVSIELVEPDDFPRDADRTTINRYLEEFYNADALPNTYVPYTIWERGSTRRLAEPRAATTSSEAGRVPESVRRLVRDRLAEMTGRRDLDDGLRLAHDLGMDSLSRADLLAWLQSEFGFPQGDTESLQTVGDVMLAACGEAVAAGQAALEPVGPRWFRGAHPAFRPENLAEMTIPQVLLAQARRSPDRAIIADQASGVRTYRDLVLAAMVLRPTIEGYPAARVGVMMPASVGGAVLTLAALFAGKTPVMVNWTLGRRHLGACLDAVGADRVLTSRILAERLASQGFDLGEVRARFVYVEDIVSRVGAVRRLAAWLRSRLSWKELDRATASDTAAILFTSGSETVPKAVPLTHRNILANVADAFECFHARPEDSILGILPPFHAFGLTTSVVLPLCLGIRAVYHPNPTDGGAIARTVEAYGATLLIGTPTFLGGVVRAAAPEQLASLRLVVTGAERCPPRVYDALERVAPQAEVLEGYGVTECSPIVSVNREGESKRGTIGRPVASVEHAVVHPETLRRVPKGDDGLLLVRGSSVFEGYLDYDGPSPFVEFEGAAWYHTGDLVSEGAGGILSFAARLKRFVKLGGEMVSLPAIEAALEPHYQTDDDEGPVLAVVATPGDDRPEIVLFTVKDVDRSEANAAIRAAGLSGLHHVHRVIRLDELPLLGTGKTDYRTLTARLAAE